RAIPGSRPGPLPALGGDPRGAAQLQDHRHLHAAVAARWQAGLTPPYPAGMAAPRRRFARAGIASGCRLARPAPASRDAARAGGKGCGMTALPKSAMVLAAGLG